MQSAMEFNAERLWLEITDNFESTTLRKIKVYLHTYTWRLMLNKRRIRLKGLESTTVQLLWKQAEFELKRCKWFTCFLLFGVSDAISHSHGFCTICVGHSLTHTVRQLGRARAVNRAAGRMLMIDCRTRKEERRQLDWHRRCWVIQTGRSELLWAGKDRE